MSNTNLFDPMFPRWGLVVMPPSTRNSTMTHHEERQHMSEELPCSRVNFPGPTPPNIKIRGWAHVVSRQRLGHTERWHEGHTPSRVPRRLCIPGCAMSNRIFATKVTLDGGRSNKEILISRSNFIQQTQFGYAPGSSLPSRERGSSSESARP